MKEETIIMMHHMMFLMTRSIFRDSQEVLKEMRSRVAAITFGDEADRRCANRIIDALEQYSKEEA